MATNSASGRFTGYDRNEVHVAVDDYVNSHLITAGNTTYRDALERIYKNSQDAGLADIACSTAQAKFLRLQVQIAGAKSILEVGTLGGYSAAWMASAGPDVKVTTVEVDPKTAAVATSNIKQAGLESQVEIINGPGIEVLPKVAAEVEAKKRPVFDLVFIDANKEQNLDYLNIALPVTRSGGVIIVDNVVRWGRVASAEEAAKDARIKATRNLIETVGKDSRLDGVVLQTVGEKSYDGFLLTVKK